MLTASTYTHTYTHIHATTCTHTHTHTQSCITGVRPTSDIYISSSAVTTSVQLIVKETREHQRGDAASARASKMSDAPARASLTAEQATGAETFGWQTTSHPKVSLFLYSVLNSCNTDIGSDTSNVTFDSWKV